MNRIRGPILLCVAGISLASDLHAAATPTEDPNLMLASNALLAGDSLLGDDPLLPGDPLLASNPLPAGDPLPANKSFDYLLPYRDDSTKHKYVQWLWKDPVNLFTRPLYWHGDEWRTFGIEAGITGALMPLDDRVRDLFQDPRNSGRDSALDAFRTISGDGATFLVAGAALFGSGLLADNERLADSGFLAFESVAYAGILATAIKSLAGRERPATAEDQWNFQGPGSGSSNSSFVSGEAAVAFAFASSMSEVWQNNWVTWPAYIFATGVALQRVNDNRHWLSDVVGAAFLGQAVGKNIVRFHYRRDSNGSLQPYITGDTVGVQLTYQF